MCNLETTQITFRVTPEELNKIDATWRSNFKYKNRTEYIRNKLGLKSQE